MNNLENIKHITQLYGAVLNLRKDDDYVVNKPQMDKFIEMLEFFINIVYKNKGYVEPIKLLPKAEHGGVTASFIVLDIYGDDIQKYCKIMSYASAITIDGTENGICISATIPEIFIPIDK